MTYLALATYRNPLLLAKCASTLDKLSGGRLILGLGTGYLKSEMRALGVDPSERQQLVHGALEVLPLHWSGQPFNYVGKDFSARDFVALPRPTQSPIPIWIGGNSAAAKRRVVQGAQGWMPMIGPPALADVTQTPALTSFEDAARAIREVRAAAASAGRTDTLDFICNYGDSSIHCPSREADRHREILTRMEESGLTWMSISHPRAEPPVVADFIEEFGSAYIAGTGR